MFCGRQNLAAASPDRTIFPEITPKTALHWFVGICESEPCCRCTEIRISGVLTAAGIENYLPLRLYTQYSGGQKIIRRTPIFPGYIFARGDAAAVRATRGIMGILRDELSERLDREIAAIRAAVEIDPGLKAVFGIQPGYRCRVLPPHAMQGREGTVESHGHRGRIWIGITMLGGYISLEIDPALVEVIDDHHAPKLTRHRNRMRPAVAAMAMC